MSAELIGKLQNLAERRRAHFQDLYQTGRWRRYYSESEFAACERDVVALADVWGQMARPGSE